MKIKDIYDALWEEAFVRIGNDDTLVWEGYSYQMPYEYMELKFTCLVPMYDYGPVIGIEI